MKNGIIYQDLLRSIAVEGDHLVICNGKGERRISLCSAIRNPESNETAALIKGGYEPKDWYVICIPYSRTKHGLFGGGALAICPPESRTAVEKALAEYCAEVETAQRDVANLAWGRIQELRAEARRWYQQGEWSASIQADEEADKAQAAWSEAYPEQARALKVQILKSKAEELYGNAQNALLYDCDGSLTFEMQEERAQDFRRKAGLLLDEAAALAGKDAP